MKNRTFYNIISGVLLQIAIAINGILIPNLILQFYGSVQNGLIVSINQIISYLALIESGIGAVGIVALYGPLVHKDQNKISSVLSAVNKLYRKSGLIYLAAVLVVGVLYPYLVTGQVSPVLVTSMFYILSCSNLIDYLFLGKYKVLLSADEKLYIVNFSQIISYFLITIFSVICIYSGCSLVFVKAIPIFASVFRFLFICIYVKKKYPYLSFKATPDYSKMGERWDSLIHQITAIVVGNTDVLLITVMMGSSSLLEVSVYSTYNLVPVMITSLFGTLSAGLQARFGKLLMERTESLNRQYALFEKLFYSVLAIVFSCASVLLLDFVLLYTKGVTDVDYYRPLIATVFVFNCLIQNIRIPGVTLICAAGKFKETRNRAILEAVINIGISVLLIPKLGILGALLGTTASYFYRTTDVLFYSNRLLEKYPLIKTGKHILVAAISFGISILLMMIVNRYLSSETWLQWCIKAIIDLLIGTVTTVTILLISDKHIRNLVQRKEV